LIERNASGNRENGEPNTPNKIPPCTIFRELAASAAARRRRLRIQRRHPGHDRQTACLQFPFRPGQWSGSHFPKCRLEVQFRKQAAIRSPRPASSPRWDLAGSSGREPFAWLITRASVYGKRFLLKRLHVLCTKYRGGRERSEPCCEVLKRYLCLIGPLALCDGLRETILNTLLTASAI